jgi:hypothetical protein
MVDMDFAEFTFHALRCIRLSERCARVRYVACLEVLVTGDTYHEKVRAPWFAKDTS